MEPQDVASSAPAEEAVTPLSLGLLETVLQAQNLHGLQHQEYTRYRQYCSRRLRRLFKSLKFTHGRGKYQRRALNSTPSPSDARYLHIPLVSAERAWAHAQDLSNAAEEGGAGPLTARHASRRLGRATVHASALAELADACADARTAAEARAYGAYVRGLSLARGEREWAEASAALEAACLGFRELGNSGASLEASAAARAFLDRARPVLRLCARRLGTAEALRGVLEDEAEACMEIDGKNVGQDPSLVPSQRVCVSWLGESHAVVDARVAALAADAAQAEERALLADHEAEADGPEDRGRENSSSARRLALFDRAINAWAAAAQAAAAALALLRSAGGAEAEAASWAALDRALRGRACALRLRRSRALARGAARAALAARLAALCRAPGPTRGASSSPGSRAEDAIRAYDLVGAAGGALAELAAEAGGRAGESLLEAALAHQAGARALQAAYGCLLCLERGRPAEARALAARAAQRLRAAQDGHRERAEGEDDGQLGGGALEELDQARELVEGLAGVALAVMGGEQAALRDEVASLALGAAEKEGGYLEDRLGEYRAFAGGAKDDSRVARFPPVAPPQPLRPIVLDLAFNEVRFPKLERRLGGEPKAGKRLGLFGW